jgi:hypothetical protein
MTNSIGHSLSDCDIDEKFQNEIFEKNIKNERKVKNIPKHILEKIYYHIISYNLNCFDIIYSYIIWFISYMNVDLSDNRLYDWFENHSKECEMCIIVDDIPLCPHIHMIKNWIVQNKKIEILDKYIVDSCIPDDRKKILKDLLYNIDANKLLVYSINDFNHRKEKYQISFRRNSYNKSQKNVVKKIMPKEYKKDSLDSIQCS